MWKGVEHPLPAIKAPSVGSLPCFMSAPTKVCWPLHNPPLCIVNVECACCCRPPSRGMATNSAGSDGAHATGRNNGKGLRHFSMKVCEKVESKGRTTYNEVADELVGEFSGAPHNPPLVITHCCAALLRSCNPCATIRAGEQCRIAMHVRCGVTVWHIVTPSMGLTVLCCAVGAFVLRSVTTPQKVFLTAAHKLIATILHACCAHDPDARPLASAGSPGIAAYDEKNIRRRVYDALNVLMAMDIIVKDKKDISWQGLPSAPHAQLEKLKEERAALRQKILNQQAYLQVCQSLKPCTAMMNMLTSPGADHVGLLMGASS